MDNLKGQLEMKEDVAKELKAAFDRRNDLDAMYVPAKCLPSGSSLPYPLPDSRSFQPALGLLGIQLIVLACASSVAK